jgi:predicted O-linked N-acetylglucosamine transferase (SPINDLY family)
VASVVFNCIENIYKFRKHLVEKDVSLFTTFPGSIFSLLKILGDIPSI